MVTLWLFNIAVEAMALIEIDDLPIKMVDLSSSLTVHNHHGTSPCL